MLRIVLVTSLVAVSCSRPPPPPPPRPVALTQAQKDEILALLDGERARIKGLEKARDAAFAHAPETLRITERACPIGRQEFGLTDELTHSGVTSLMLGKTRLVLTDAQRTAGKASSNFEIDAYQVTMSRGAVKSRQTTRSRPRAHRCAPSFPSLWNWRSSCASS